MKTNNKCPICRAELKPGELLLSHYYAPRDYWVLLHLRRSAPGEIDSPIIGDSTTLPGYRTYCALAGFQIEKT